ncbi:MAG: hypothetical protein UU63_C0006G0018 [Candidatus Uhrbacteria bacterium GW2011_GWF2_41_430]|nr:MAG: hypothetical protein UU63_C0006G0018 [Candidatus Uhrbacteria bacterium GW2011_GWF2_41_430]
MINLQELFNDHQLYHSEFQQDYLITVRAGGTTYGQYKQALRELYKRYRGLKELYSSKELLRVDIDELAAAKTCNQFEQRRNDIKRTQKVMSMEELDKNIEDTEREFKRFYAQACALKSQIGDLTPEKRNALDRDMWEYKLKEMAAIDILTTGHLGNVTYEMITAAPVEMRRKVLTLCGDKARLIDWYESKTAEMELPESQIDVKMLME